MQEYVAVLCSKGMLLVHIQVVYQCPRSSLAGSLAFGPQPVLVQEVIAYGGSTLCLLNFLRSMSAHFPLSDTSTSSMPPNLASPYNLVREHPTSSSLYATEHNSLSLTV